MKYLILFILLLSGCAPAISSDYQLVASTKDVSIYKVYAEGRKCFVTDKGGIWCEQ